MPWRRCLPGDLQGAERGPGRKKTGNPRGAGVSRSAGDRRSGQQGLALALPGSASSGGVVAGQPEVHCGTRSIRPGAPGGLDRVVAEGRLAGWLRPPGVSMPDRGRRLLVAVQLTSTSRSCTRDRQFPMQCGGCLTTPPVPDHDDPSAVHRGGRPRRIDRRCPLPAAGWFPR